MLYIGYNMSVSARRLKRAGKPESIGSKIVGADPVGSKSYPIPEAGAIFISPSGNDSNSGSVSAPLATLKSAISKVASGGTIILRAGVYHEQVSQNSNIGTPFTIQNYPGEEVWFDGTRVVDGWTQSGSVWVAPYDLVYNRQLDKGSAISNWPGSALRAHVDQAWLNDVPLTQIQDATTPANGQFSVNQANGTITIADNPSGRTVRVADLNYVLLLRSPATIRGIGFRRYSPVNMEFLSAFIYMHADSAGSTIEQCVFQESSMGHLQMYASDGNTIRRCTFEDCGHTSVSAGRSSGGVFTQNIIRRANRGGWAAEPATAGLKTVLALGGFEYSHNHISDVPGAYGLWTDTSVSRMKIINNTIDGSATPAGGAAMKHCIEVEASDGGFYGGVQYYNYIVGNRCFGADKAGLMLFDSGWCEVWNNYFKAGVGLYIRQDYRANDGSRASLEGTPESNPWQSRENGIVNNVFVPTDPYRTQLRAESDSNASTIYAGGAMFNRLWTNWFRFSTYTSPSGFVFYLGNNTGTAQASFGTLASLASAGAAYGGPLAAKMSGNLQQDTTPTVSAATPLPNDVAAAYGVPVGSQGIGPLLPDLQLAS